MNTLYKAVPNPLIEHTTWLPVEQGESREDNQDDPPEPHEHEVVLVEQVVGKQADRVGDIPSTGYG